MLTSIDDRELQRLFDGALDALVGMDAEGRVIAWNSQAEALFGWSRSEALLQRLGDLIVPHEMREAHETGLRRYLQTGEGPVINTRIEVRATNRSGASFPVELTVVPVGERGAERFFAFLRDISSRREHERRLRQRALEAEVLWEATELVAAGGTVSDLLYACVEKICRVSDWPVGHVYLPDDANDPHALIPSAVWFFERPELQTIAQENERYAFGPGVGLPGQIWAAGKAVWIPDIPEGENLPRKGMWLKHGLHAAFGFPVFYQGKLQAVLEFFSAARQAPDEHLLLIIQGVGQQLGRVLERQRAHEQQELLLHELSHRVGNLLAVATSVFRMSAQHAASKEDLVTSFQSRLSSMSDAHRLLAAGEWQSADLEKMVRTALKPYCRQDFSNCEVRGPEISVPASAVLSFIMVLHELSTNAAKHGGFSSAAGSVEVTWRLQQGAAAGRRLSLSWRERNPDPVRGGAGSGYGTKLIDTSVERGLGGTIKRSFDVSGLLVEMDIPIK